MIVYEWYCWSFMLLEILILCWILACGYFTSDGEDLNDQSSEESQLDPLSLVDFHSSDKMELFVSYFKLILSDSPDWVGSEEGLPDLTYNLASTVE